MVDLESACGKCRWHWPLLRLCVSPLVCHYCAAVTARGAHICLHCSIRAAKCAFCTRKLTRIKATKQEDLSGTLTEDYFQTDQCNNDAIAGAAVHLRCTKLDILLRIFQDAGSMNCEKFTSIATAIIGKLAKIPAVLVFHRCAIKRTLPLSFETFIDALYTVCGIAPA